jgi:DNA-binding NarL/FixJ family response regulator
MPRLEESLRPTKILIISRYRLYAECLATALQKTGLFAVEITTLDKPQICALIETNSPGIVLLISDYQDELFVELTTFLSRAFVGAKILILGCHASEPWAVHYLEAGAQGYLPDDISLSDIDKAIQQVARGEVVCSQYATPFIFGRLANLCGEKQPLQGSESHALTMRECEIIELMAAGLTNWQIAERLSISAHTVKNHVHNILSKLQVSKRLLAVQEVYGRRTNGGITATPDRGPNKPKFPSSVRNAGLTGSQKHGNSDSARAQVVSR